MILYYGESIYIMRKGRKAVETATGFEKGNLVSVGLVWFCSSYNLPKIGRHMPIMICSYFVKFT